MRKLNWEELGSLVGDLAKVKEHVDLLFIEEETFRVYKMICGDYTTYQVRKCGENYNEEETILRSAELGELREFIMLLKSEGVHNLNVNEPETVEIEEDEEEDEVLHPTPWDFDNGEIFKVVPVQSGKLEVSKWDEETLSFKYIGDGCIASQYYVPRDGRLKILPGIFILPDCSGKLKVMIDGQIQSGHARIISEY